MSKLEPTGGHLEKASGQTSSRSQLQEQTNQLVMTFVNACHGSRCLGGSSEPPVTSEPPSHRCRSIDDTIAGEPTGTPIETKTLHVKHNGLLLT
ncbi:MAG: hypothetical protein CBB71_14210 [Rhodopirellula sp. TMED11]|nr:MAG: hypothetical protein CBB71_14210 [Rhodopirellula sp. TMED11]